MVLSKKLTWRSGFVDSIFFIFFRDSVFSLLRILALWNIFFGGGQLFFTIPSQQILNAAQVRILNRILRLLVSCISHKHHEKT